MKFRLISQGIPSYFKEKSVGTFPDFIFIQLLISHNNFLARLDKVQEDRKSYCITPGVGVGVSKKFNIKVFYVMGKALSGELSCPCDRSCLI